MFASLMGNRAVLEQLAALAGRSPAPPEGRTPQPGQPGLDCGGRSYLLAGPEGVGKRSAAWELAAALNCLKKGMRPCGRCQSCLEWRGGGHRDLKLIAPRSETAEGKRRTQGVITVEAAREARDWLSLKPSYAYRVLVIDGAEGLSVSDAGDVLLKVLEEPPPRAVLFLVAADEEALAATVRSRCQIFRFHPLTEAELLQLPALAALPATERRSVVALAAGSAGVAQALAVDWDVVSARRREMMQVLRQLRRAQPPELLERLEALEKWLGDPILPSLLAVARSWYRDLRRLRLDLAPFDSTWQAELADELSDWSLADLELALWAVEDAHEALGKFVSTRATANVLILRLAGVLPADGGREARPTAGTLESGL
ncbi:MAG: hypothetical protein HY335_08475 [Deinococcus sp.]|nr:hypothetical protein [Deinococcus sp.]